MKWKARFKHTYETTDGTVMARFGIENLVVPDYPGAYTDVVLETCPVKAQVLIKQGQHPEFEWEVDGAYEKIVWAL